MQTSPYHQWKASVLVGALLNEEVWGRLVCRLVWPRCQRRRAKMVWQGVWLVRLWYRARASFELKVCRPAAAPRGHIDFLFIFPKVRLGWDIHFTTRNETTLFLNQPINIYSKQHGAAGCKYWEFADKSESDFLVYCQEKQFGELSSMIAIKLPKEFKVLRNLAKREIPRTRQKLP